LNEISVNEDDFFDAYNILITLVC